MNRRNFLQQSASGIFAAGLGAAPETKRTAKRPEKVSDVAKLKRIGICSWSHHNYFAQTRDKNLPATAKVFDLREYPALIADQYHIHSFELCSTHFASTDPGYLSDLKAAVEKAQGAITNIPVDMESDWNGKGLCDPDDAQWRREIDARKKWIDIAATLGAQSIRPNPGGTAAMTDLSRPIAAYKELAAYGQSKGVKVLIENHGNVAATAENIVAIIQAAGPPWAGTLPDFGNFPDAERYHGLELMMPLAQTVCHARDLEPREGGKESTFDFRRCVQIAQSARFNGIYSVEFGGQDNVHRGVQRIINLLLKNL
jgi:sugar phosphate isomerase/epimerase